MSKTSGYDKFELKWSISTKRKRSKDGSDYWHFLRYKEEIESFEEFFNLLQRRDKYITANYIINGNDFTQYLNIYSYHYRLDQPTSNYNLLTFAFNNSKLEQGENIKDKINLPFQKFALKQILGENIAYKDVAALYSRKNISEEEFENIIQNTLKAENEDITFYCCCVCADRECGYCSMQIIKEKESVRWEIPINYHRPYIFERQEYENAFADFKEFVDSI
ncbi:hypothetical protein V9L05_09960 [Bernardetia sp. Wsw4-3y2]|uniref:hypothetical protein n=1 Tax=Bernardetia sp. Wsw4-3y2 TaxID=3127471 RepID=UPI0030CACF22